MQPILIPLSILYAAAIQLRNARYHSGTGVVRAPIPVISVGNVSVGGTGKTPLVIEIARRLIAAGRRPAILSRGYGGTATHEADEVLEFRAALTDTLVVVNPDRVHGAESAAKLGADCAILDDGFQHRRLFRELDLVLIDALNPWAGNWVLPAGRLREPLGNLARAGAIIITRSNHVTHEEVDQIRRRLFQLSPGTTIFHATLDPVAFVREDGSRESPENLGLSNVLPVCGVGNPRSFLRMIELLAGRVAPARIYRDHHDYSAADVTAIVRHAREEGCDLVLTTRKDWVKLAPLWKRGGPARPPLAWFETRTSLGSDAAGLHDRILKAVEKRT